MVDEKVKLDIPLKINKHTSDEEDSKNIDITTSKNMTLKDTLALVNTNEPKENRGARDSTSSFLSRDEKGNEIEEPLKRTLFMRYFSPIKQGSVRSSIMAISAVCLGMGTLAIPKVLSQISFVLGLTLIFVGGAVGYWSLNILALASEKIGSNSYSEAVRQTFGTCASIILDLTIILYIFGNLIGYFIVSKLLIKL